MPRWGAFILAVGLGAAPAAAAPLAFRDEASTAGRVVRLGDIADLSALPAKAAQQAAGLEIVIVTSDAPAIRISERQAARLVRGRMPAIAAWLPADTAQVIQVRLRPSSSRAVEEASCLRVARPVTARSFPTVADFMPAACGTTALQGVFRYERNVAAARALVDLKPGEVVEAPAPSSLAVVHPGQRLEAVAKVGVVSIEREVEALQTARPGGGLFVRADDGAVFSLSFQDVRP